MFLLHLPPTLPMTRQSAAASVQDAPSISERPVGVQAAGKPCNLDELQSGLLGKLLVYKSGAVKLKLGDTLYDVSITSTSYIRGTISKFYCINLNSINAQNSKL